MLLILQTMNLKTPSLFHLATGKLRVKFHVPLSGMTVGVFYSYILGYELSLWSHLPFYFNFSSLLISFSISEISLWYS